MTLKIIRGHLHTPAADPLDDYRDGTADRIASEKKDRLRRIKATPRPKQ